MKKRLSFAQQTCVGKAGLAMQKTGMIWPGCRVGIAVSGGVDSFVLLQVMRWRQRITPFKFEIMALHCNPGFDCDNHSPLLPWLAARGVSAHIEVANHGPLAHSPENRKSSPCFFCAWLRRKKLFDLCRQYNLTHLALGHNADDLATTFLLNILRNGRASGLSASESFFKGSLRLIRPLILLEKKYIRQAARQWNLPVWSNPCPSSGKTARQDMDDLLNRISNELPGARRSLINALARQILQDSTEKE